MPQMIFDPMYLLALLPGLLLSMWASHRVKSTYRRYSEVGARSGLTGAETAHELMRCAGIRDVRIEPVQGVLSDHYDPSHKVLRLSSDVYQGRSLSAIGVAAHEAGHALQHATGYAPLELRSLVVRPAMIGSNLGITIAGIGLLLQTTAMIWLGILLFSAFVVFTLITLPVEFNASSRALATLKDTGILVGPELDGASAVLNAAAMTYVASAASAIIQLLYFVWRAGLLGGRDE
jgi:Zn-dependent membrane protease YugP